MAEEEAQENEEGADQAEGEGEEKSSKSSLKLLGGVVGLLGAGTALALMAMPKKDKTPSFDGPAMHNLVEPPEVVGNPLDDNYARYFRFHPSCSFMAYDLGYPEGRRADPHYEPLLREAISTTISTYTMDELMSGNSETWLPELIESIVEPILFPVHLGETATPYDQHEESGLRLGPSQEREGTFRGAFFEHTLHVDVPEKTMQLDDGPEVTFESGAFDVLVEAPNGSKVYVDVSAANEEFVGDIHIGVMGRIRRLFPGDKMAQ